MLRFRGALLVLVSLAFSLFIFVQCSDNAVIPESDPEPPKTTVSKMIDQNGGELRLNNEAWVIIPPGALDSALVVTIKKISNPVGPPVNYVSRGASYGFTPHTYIFNDSVTIGVIYEPDTALAAPAMTKLADDADTSWEAVPGASCAGGTAICKSLTFSILSVNSFQPLEEVYVSKKSQRPNAAGTRDDPLPTISAGIAAAQAAGQPYPPVLVATGIYEESLVFVDGVSIQGGLDPETWEFPAEPIEYSVVDLNTTAADATGITGTTRIVGLVLSADDAVNHLEPNSIALHVVNCREGLRFVNCRFIAGNGRDGNDGPKGFDGSDGGAGQPSGRSGGIIYNNNYMVGGPGGSSSMYSGGKGGNGVYAGCGYQGGHGQGNKVAICGGACGGVGAWCGGGLGSFDGGNGPNGANGANGAGGSNEGVFTNGWWWPTGAGSGAHGEHGCGGGGGGGGSLLVEGGLGGGGGGGGGTRGGGGGGGMSGGSSFAVFLWESSPVFVNCEFITGNGGRGGKGGDGGNRGAGSAGGICYGSTNFWIKGGNGGTGGNGGFGGSGGGGAGGHSFCVYRYGNVCLNADFSGCNPWDWYPGVPGRGGDGGQASNDIAEGPQADRGDDGKAGLIGPE